jgi:hypothetical protein
MVALLIDGDDEEAVTDVADCLRQLTSYDGQTMMQSDSQKTCQSEVSAPIVAALRACGALAVICPLLKRPHPASRVAALWISGALLPLETDATGALNKIFDM